MREEGEERERDMSANETQSRVEERIEGRIDVQIAHTKRESG